MDDKNQKIYITGATGFIGSALFEKLQDLNCFDIERLTRDQIQNQNGCQSQSIFIHLAGKAHDKGATWDDFEKGNILLTKKLLTLCQKHHAKKIIFISSSKVYGEKNDPIDSLFRESEVSTNLSLYGQSKIEAESIIKKSNIPYIILRPPLVFGENAKGNLSFLKRISNLGLPMPKNIVNKRSFVERDYLIDIIIKCLDTRFPANQTLNVANLNLSTSDFFNHIGIQPLANYPTIIFKCIPSKIKGKLFDNFQLDCSLLENTLKSLDCK